MISKEILYKINEVIEIRRKGHIGALCVAENMVIRELCLHPDFELQKIVQSINAKKESNPYNEHQIIGILQSLKLGSRAERREIIQSALEMTQVLYDFFNGDLLGYKRFLNCEQKSYDNLSRDYYTTWMRCILIGLFTKFPQLEKLSFSADVYCRGGVRCKACLTDIVHKVYKIIGSNKQIEETQEEQLAQKEKEILRLNEMLEEIQNEFEMRLEESKTQEITSFFQALNSEKYGYILDGLFSAKAGLEELRKQNYELPLEINGLTILVRKLIQFVKDSGINPVIRTGEDLTVTSHDIESYNYLGSPFVFEGEKKHVTVISPGWIYKEKDIHLSRPTIKEVTKESV
ncbi:MAG: hypothetical protein LBD29_05565 [Treponema sp.]|jgi:hypothetical protein|nr:hypothetical protein [Treponema sp.]